MTRKRRMFAMLAVVAAVVGLCVGYYYWEQPLTYSEVEGHVRDHQLTHNELEDALAHETSIEITVCIPGGTDDMRPLVERNVSKIIFAADTDALPEDYYFGRYAAWESPVDYFLGKSPGTIYIIYNRHDRVVGCIRGSQLND